MLMLVVYKGIALGCVLVDGTCAAYIYVHVCNTL